MPTSKSSTDKRSPGKPGGGRNAAGPKKARGAKPGAPQAAAPKAAAPKAAAKPPKPSQASELDTAPRASTEALRASLRSRALVALAEVARPHGLQGELRLRVYNPDSDLLARRPRVRLVSSDGIEREAAITAAREADKALLVRVSGVDDRDAAEALRGTLLCVPRSALPPAEDGEFYAWDVEGARAVLPSGEAVGRVVELASYPTCDVLVVARDGEPPVEVPVTDAYVKRVDVAAGVVELVTIDGLD